MNAPLPRATLAAFRAAVPPAERPRAVFEVRRRSMMTFEVVRTLSGPGVTPLEELPATFGPFQGEDAANQFAARAAVRFSQNHPGTVAIAMPFPQLGRRPGQVYRAAPRDPDDEHRMSAEQLGIVRRAS